MAVFFLLLCSIPLAVIWQTAPSSSVYKNTAAIKQGSCELGAVIHWIGLGVGQYVYAQVRSCCFKIKTQYIKGQWLGCGRAHLLLRGRWTSKGFFLSRSFFFFWLTDVCLLVCAKVRCRHHETFESQGRPRHLAPRGCFLFLLICLRARARLCSSVFWKLKMLRLSGRKWTSSVENRLGRETSGENWEGTETVEGKS